MQSYIRFKKYYDQKPKATTLQEKDYYHILQPITDHQDSEKPFRNFKWIAPHVVEKTPPNENFIVCKDNNNKSQILHCIQLSKYKTDAPLGNRYTIEEMKID